MITDLRLLEARWALSAWAGREWVVSSILLTNARVYDIEQAQFREGMISIRNGFIEAIGQKITKSDQLEIDTEQMFLLPGLIDSHVHLCLPTEVSTSSEWVNKSDAEVALYAIKAAERTLLAGITTVRDCGSWNNVIAAVRTGIAAGQFLGPRIVSAGKQISTTTSSAEYMPGLFELGDGPDRLTEACRKQIKSGADFFILIATGAMFSHQSEGPDCLTFTREELATVAKIASDYRRTISAQGTSPEGIQRLVEIGVVSIEHGIFADQSSLELMAEKGTFLVPTLCVAKAMLADKVAANSFPDHIIRRYIDADPTHVGVVKTAHRLGVPIAMGTDAGSPGNHHGQNADECVEMHRRAGIPVAAVIRASTCDAAKLLGKHHQVGRLSRGLAADIIGCVEDPFDDITALTRVAFVMSRGAVVRNDLHKATLSTSRQFDVAETVHADRFR